MTNLSHHSPCHQELGSRGSVRDWTRTTTWANWAELPIAPRSMGHVALKFLHSNQPMETGTMVSVGTSPKDRGWKITPSKWPNFMAYTFINGVSLNTEPNWDDPPSTLQGTHISPTVWHFWRWFSCSPGGIYVSSLEVCFSRYYTYINICIHIYNINTYIYI